jgi:hypothetical protein
VLPLGTTNQQETAVRVFSPQSRILDGRQNINLLVFVIREPRREELVRSGKGFKGEVCVCVCVCT